MASAGPGDAVDNDLTSGGDIIKRSITDTDPRDEDKWKLGPETVSIGQDIN